MFKLVPNPTFKTIVNLSVPEFKGTAEVTFEFKYKNKEELDKWFAANKNKTTTEALVGLIASWSGVSAEDDTEIAFSKDHLKELLKNYPRAGQEILTAYINALSESRAKN